MTRLRGVSVGVLAAVWNTTLQTQIPRGSLGRVTAWDWMSSLALWPVGPAVAGPLAQAYGVTAMCWATGLLGLLAAFWVLLVKDVWRRGCDRWTGSGRRPPPCPRLSPQRRAGGPACRSHTGGCR